MVNKIFVDTSAFIALYVKDDDFHQKALCFLLTLKQKKTRLITSNFILDEVYTWIKVRKGVKQAVEFAEFLAENTDIVKLIRIIVQDEQEAFMYFQEVPGKGVSFTDCTSFALMKRLGIEDVFTFDNDFTKAGFKILP